MRAGAGRWQSSGLGSPPWPPMPHPVATTASWQQGPAPALGCARPAVLVPVLACVFPSAQCSGWVPHRPWPRRTRGLTISCPQVTRLCDLSVEGDSVTSVGWSERVSPEPGSGEATHGPGCVPDHPAPACSWWRATGQRSPGTLLRVPRPQSPWAVLTRPHTPLPWREGRAGRRGAGPRTVEPLCARAQVACVGPLGLGRPEPCPAPAGASCSPAALVACPVAAGPSYRPGPPSPVSRPWEQPWVATGSASGLQCASCCVNCPVLRCTCPRVRAAA